MNISNTSYADSLFSATLTPSNGLENLANKDIYNLKMNPKFDPYTGFSGVV